MDIGMKIRAARKAKGYTLEELGNMLGVQRSAVAKYENGMIKNIKRSTLKKISELLEIPPYELIFDEAQKEKPTDEDDGLTENQRKLMQFAKSVPDEKAEMILRVIRSIVESD